MEASSSLLPSAGLAGELISMVNCLGVGMGDEEDDDDGDGDDEAKEVRQQKRKVQHHPLCLPT